MCVVAVALVEEVTTFVKLVDLALTFLLFVRILLNAVCTSISIQYDDILYIRFTSAYPVSHTTLMLIWRCLGELVPTYSQEMAWRIGLQSFFQSLSSCISGNGIGIHYSYIWLTILLAHLVYDQ